jgi:uncharacterized protein (TIGR02145 family)
MLQDIEGNVYTSIIVGSKEWLVENYRATKYANGTPIANLQNSTDSLLLDWWGNQGFTSLTSSGANITNALKTSGTGYIKGGIGGNAVTLKSGDTLHFVFNLTLISGSLPTVTIYKNGTITGSTIITAGANSLNLSITEDADYNVGFQSNITGSEFSTTGTSLKSTYNNAWQDAVIGAFCWYNNDIANKSPYGALYNWYAAINPLFPHILRDGVSEIGWRVPTGAEAMDLVLSLDAGATKHYIGPLLAWVVSSTAGGLLKETGTTHWQTPNTGATNSIGFTAIPSGTRVNIFQEIAQQQTIWLLEEDLYDPTNGQMLLSGSYNNAAAANGGALKSYGLSVRLIRDYVPPTDPPEVGPGKVLTIGYEAVEFFDKFNITYSIGDIRDLSQGSSDKSYTIDLPLTKKNRHILKHLNQVDVKSEPVKGARIYMDELIIIQGKIFVLEYTDTHAKILINSDDWIENLKSRKMTDLDLSDQDHLLTNANVIGTWSGSDAFYRYPMIDFGALASGEIGLTANWSAVDFIPMIRIVDLIARILSPFTISSDWITQQFIKDLYILGREKIADANFVNGKHLELHGDSYTDNTNTSSVAASATGVAILTSHVIEFNTTITDEAPAWDAITSIYTVPETGTYRFKATLDMINTGNVAPFTEMAGQCTIYMLQSGSASNVLKTYSRPTGMVTGQIILDTSYIYLVANDTIHLEITCYSRAKNNGGAPANLTVGLDVTSKLELIWNNPTRYKGINDSIKLNEYMPEMSQADFLGAIRDTCNLRFWLDKSRQNLYIESWDAMHTPEIRDLSDLVDYASMTENPAQLISNNYSKNILMKWKDDDSDEAYNEHLRMYDSPLTKNIVLTSQFCKGDIETKEHQWSTIVEGYNLTLVDYTKQVPRIWADLITFSPIDFNRKVNFNTRIVHWDGYIACDQSWFFDSVEKTSYPKISGLSWGYLFSTYWQKIYHKIDKGKLYLLRIKVKPGFLTQFMTVIADAEKEGFRTKYLIEIDGVENYFRLQKVTSDGYSAELELILE